MRNKNYRRKRKSKAGIVIICSLAIVISAFIQYGSDIFKDKAPDIAESGGISEPSINKETSNSTQEAEAVKSEPYISEIPLYAGEQSILVSDTPLFTSEEIARATTSYYELSPFDLLGRCGPAIGSFSLDTMAEGERGSIKEVKPTGFQVQRYDNIVTDKYLYHRCHLLMWKLSGLNAEPRNLITGTRDFNEEGMLPYEMKVVDYIYKTGNHVLYRVSPIFEGDELVARGVYMEALSVEDNGEGLSFYVFVYNVQPGIKINYATGDSEVE